MKAGPDHFEAETLLPAATHGFLGAEYLPSPQAVYKLCAWQPSETQFCCCVCGLLPSYLETDVGTHSVWMLRPAVLTLPAMPFLAPWEQLPKDGFLGRGRWSLFPSRRRQTCSAVLVDQLPADRPASGSTPLF